MYHFNSKADASEYIKKGHPGLWKKASRVQVGSMRRPAANFDDTVKVLYVVAETDIGYFSTHSWLLSQLANICWLVVK
jgi:hypothetical protein